MAGILRAMKTVYRRQSFLLYICFQNGVSPQARKAVGAWLFIGCVMVFFQVVLGGITRLTESGLSITEWKPLYGAVPPLNEAQWTEEFSLYKQKVHARLLTRA